jgi:hypothetical protein
MRILLLTKSVKNDTNRSMRKRRTLSDLYRFKGFKLKKIIHGIFGDPRARVITLTRRGKKLFAANAAQLIGPGMTASSDGSAIFLAATRGFILNWS